MPATSWRLRSDWCQTFRSCKALRFQTKINQSMMCSNHSSCNQYRLLKRTLWPCQEREIPGICEVWLQWQKNALWGWVDLGGSVSCYMILSLLVSWEGARATLQKAIDDDKAWVFQKSTLSSFKIYHTHIFSLRRFFVLFWWSVCQVERSLIDACDSARLDLSVAIEPLKAKKAKKA